VSVCDRVEPDCTRVPTVAAVFPGCVELVAAVAALPTPVSVSFCIIITVLAAPLPSGRSFTFALSGTAMTAPLALRFIISKAPAPLAAPAPCLVRFVISKAPAPLAAPAPCLVRFVASSTLFLLFSWFFLYLFRLFALTDIGASRVSSSSSVSITGTGS